MDRLQTFQETVWNYYDEHGRDLPWRTPEPDGTFDAYKILVSEMMLQQTQVSRVIPKYREFLEHFASVDALARSTLGDVLRIWSGLGYNRRAKYLHDAAKTLPAQTTSQQRSAQGPTLSKSVPIGPGRIREQWGLRELMACKGIGKNTAAAMCVYAYNQPLVFIETNIRTVFIHHFFSDRADVNDQEILPLIKATLNETNPREFYWALMDYGSYLKKTVGNVARRSKHYTRQSPLQGSRRQIRGQVLRLLTEGAKTKPQLRQHIVDPRLDDVLQILAREGLIRQESQRFFLH